MKILHTADTHFSIKSDKLAEVVKTTDFLLSQARSERPDVAVIAGDVVDEHDGPIRIDSVAARAAIRFITELADVCPVVIVRGTRSHDRETPYLFEHLAGRHPIHVASKIEMVALLADNTFETYGDDLPCMDGDIKAVFTLLPSPEKSNLIAAFGTDSVGSSNMIAKEALNDMMGYLGEINSQVPGGVPRVLVGHGMITGAVFSTGSVATGEDFEYCLSDLNLSNCDAKLFGHIHKHQVFPGNIFYSGSPGRLNMGEAEVKGFLVHSFAGNTLEDTRFIETPARRWALYGKSWDANGVDAILEQVKACEADCAGADVRFRYSIPEESRHLINKAELTARFLAAGALTVKIEGTPIPTVHLRGAGISGLGTLAEKGTRWGEDSRTEITSRAVSIFSVIEGRDVDELIGDALLAIESASQFQQVPVVVRQLAPVIPMVLTQEIVAADSKGSEQFGLFG